VNYLLGAEKSPVLDGLLSFDIAGISVRTKEDLYPFTLSTAEMDSVAACYADAATQDGLIWGPCKFVWSDIILARQMDKSAMLHAWFAATVGHPVAYIRHRLKYFGALLAVTTRSPSIWQDGIVDNHFGLETRRHGLYHVLAGYVRLLSSTLLFRPITWFITSVLLMLFAASKKLQLDDEKTNFVMTSGLLGASYMLTYLPVGVASDFRYAYLCVVMTTFALCALIGELHGSSTKGDERDVDGRRGQIRTPQNWHD
jgi:hypothetical protein